jgi:hypothetical protein
MRNGSLVALAALVLGIVLAPADESAAQGRTVTVTGVNGKTATATTNVDSDASDGTVGAQHTIIGFNGKTASSSAERPSRTTRSSGSSAAPASVVGPVGRRVHEGR